MSVQTLPGMSIPWHGIPPMAQATPSLGTTLVIDATGEKVAFCGRVFFPSRTGTKDIRTLGFRFGTVTKAGGSALTVSLQNVLNAGAGYPMVPDETQDQTVAIANADAAFVSNTWLQTGNLSADRTVAFGELVAVVLEYDGSGRLGADTVMLSGLAAQNAGPTHGATGVLKTASWAAQATIPNLILGFSDGTFGTLQGAFPFSALASVSYHSGTAGADEYALELTFPGPVKIDGGGGTWGLTNSSTDVELICYDGTTPMTDGTAVIDADYGATASVRPGVGPFAAMLSLAANTTYRLALKPTAASAVLLSYIDVAAAGHFQAHVGGEAWAMTSRVDGGAWAAPTATRRPFLWPYVCAIDDAVGGAGGGAAMLINSGGLVG
jgi:hypothetical protein